jgi:hypothetical protein
VAHALLRAASPLLATPGPSFTVFAGVRTRHVENVRHGYFLTYPTVADRMPPWRCDSSDNA